MTVPEHSGCCVFADMAQPADVDLEYECDEGEEEEDYLPEADEHYMDDPDVDDKREGRSDLSAICWPKGNSFLIRQQIMSQKRGWFLCRGALIALWKVLLSLILYPKKFAHFEGQQTNEDSIQHDIREGEDHKHQCSKHTLTTPGDHEKERVAPSRCSQERKILVGENKGSFFSRE